MAWPSTVITATGYSITAIAQARTGRKIMPALDVSPFSHFMLVAFSHDLPLQVARSALGHIGAVPPSAAQSLKQRGCVGVTIRLGLHKVNEGLLIGLFRAQEREVVRVAGFKLFLRQVEGDACGIFGGCRGLQGVGVLLERIKGIRDILERGEDSAAILFIGLGVSCSCGALPMLEHT